MRESDVISNIERWFLDYISKFDENESIQIKIEHSLLVERLSWELSNIITSNRRRFISTVVGLLHDIGRFAQIKDYGTMLDHKSIDHAELGVEILKKEGVLEEYFGKNDCRLIYQAIYYHNKIELPLNAMNFYARLIRDIDKLDIYRIAVNWYSGKVGSNFSDKAIKCALNGEQIQDCDINSKDDACLVYLMWLYDLNFKAVYKRMKDDGYISILRSYLPKDDIFEKILLSLDKYVIKSFS